MSNELHALLSRVENRDPATANELRRHIDALSRRRGFGLNFERHIPEQVALVGRRITVGDKVRFIPPRGDVTVESSATWLVTKISGTKGRQVAELLNPKTKEHAARTLDDLVYVADFRDPIYPGLVATGRVERGGGRPYHTVINAENYHALEAMLFAHQGKVDCIYIDPPYNTRDNDWKYNNNYVDPDDSYAHSMWLAFMERRLRIAKRLLDPTESVLIVTIDEKEVLRLGLLLEQIFPSGTIQMVSATVNPKGTSRPKMFSRVDEFIFFVLLGDAAVPDVREDAAAGSPVRWRYLRREDDDSRRGTRPRQFYPVFVDPETRRIVDVGDPIAPNVPVASIEAPKGLVAVFPVREDGVEMEWGLTGPSLMKAARQGFARATPGHEKQPFIISYLTGPNIKRIEARELVVSGVRDDGSKIVVSPKGKASRPKTVWRETRHSAGDYGTKMLGQLLPGRKFPFPKSLYAVEDTLRFFVTHKPSALVVDFFAGSGTTAHAVMRLNRQDGGRRRTVCITNNEVSVREQAALAEAGHRPGDPEWEALGICDYVTKPRIKAAVTGLTPDGGPVEGEYKFTDPFPMSDGFEENVEFFTLTYENPALVELDLAFERIAPLLWMRAGSEGRRIEHRTDTFEVADTYAVLFNVDASREFIDSVDKVDGVRVAFVVTDDETQYQAVASQLPDDVETVRLYESYLRTFQINTGRF